MRHVIVVEDEQDLAELVAHHLRQEGYRVGTHADGAAGWDAIRSERPSLVVLDLMLPGMDGFEILRRIRREPELAGTAILMLTARAEDVDVVTGLELGADDYVVKPVSPRVLVARVRSLLRRGEPVAEEGAATVLGDLEIDPARHEVRKGGEVLDLTPTEFRILRFLARRPGHVRTRADILDAIGEATVLERTIDVHVASLRKKLGDSAALVETVRGVGYRAKSP